MNLINAKKNIFFFIFLLSYVPLYAQQKTPRFEHITGEVNATENVITKIQQDSQGYLWIVSFDGLLKYDGYTIIKYQYNPFDLHSVSQNMIYTFFIDSKDTMWLGTPEGLCKFDRTTDIFTRYNNSLIPNMPDLGNVSAINEDEQGNLWIGNYEGRIWRYNKKTNEFLALTSKFDYQKQKSLAADFHETLACMYKNKKGTIWIGNSNGLHRVNIKTGKPGSADDISFTHYQHDPADANSLSNNDVNGIYEDNSGIIWAATIFGGLNSVDPATGKITRFLNDPSNPSSISTNNLQVSGDALVEDKENNLWIATRYGLNKLNKERTAFTHYFQDVSDFGLKANYIRSLCIDAGANLIISTDKGLYSVILNQKAFGLMQHDPKDNNSISDNEVTAVIEDRSGAIWVGTLNGGLDKWDKTSGKFMHYQHDPKNPNSLKTNYVSDIMEYPDGNFWVCNGEYLSLLKTQTGLFEHFNSDSRHLTDDDARNIFSICHDHDGMIWMGTGNGIKSFDPVSKKFTHYYYEAGNRDGISDYTVVGILADSRGNIWVGNNSIAFDRFDKRTGKFIHYKNDPLDSTSISSNIVSKVFEDSKGNLWIGTFGGGLCQYNYSTNNFITHTRNKDIPWHSVFSIEEDNAGNLWLGTEKGLSCYLISQKRFINYDIKDGLQSNIFGAGWRGKGSAFKGRDGILYFGGKNGLNYFDPAQIHPNNYVPPVVITQFKIFDKLQPGKNEDKEIVLNYNQNFFSFEFAALNYTNTSKNKYAYQLEGFDDDWIYSGSRRYAGYTNLDPGNYTFKVKGSNNDGIWNEKGV